MICQACDQPWKNVNYGLSAMHCAACTSSIEAIQELLVQSKYAIDLSGTLAIGMVYNRGARHVLQVKV